MKITIKRTYPFWVWLCRFAYRKAKSKVKFGTGIPGNRDPENPCIGYSPRKRTDGDSEPECDGDGHYLCKECIFFNNLNQK